MQQTIEQDEGFTDDSTIQYTEYNYRPYIRSNYDTYKIYTNPLKLCNKNNIIHNDKYINKQLQLQLSNNFNEKYKTAIIQPFNLLNNNKDNNFIFDSNFQSGNLQYVIMKNKQIYQLFIKPDSNTTTHFQWFYFKIKNKQQGNITLIIKNFIKQKMLYNNGLRPYYRSLSKNKLYYQQISKQVKYLPSNQENNKQYYQLIFDYTFEISNDQVQFCSQPPYTHTRYLSIYKIFHHLKIDISRTVLGHKIEAYIINQKDSNVVVVAMARQHPGQSIGSWLIQGFSKKIIQSSSSVCWILIPMVNVDGVILGNNRTGVQGYDFNRNWCVDEDASRYHLFPELSGIIGYFKRKKREYSKKLKIFLDFHSHSSSNNVFCYGTPHLKTSQYYELNKLFPYLINKKNNDFNLDQCSYKIQNNKKYCSRNIFYNKFGFNYTYTIQSSFGIYRGRRINQYDIIKMGQDIFQSLLEFIQLLLIKDKNNIIKLLSEMKENIHQNYQYNYDSDSDYQEQSTIIRKHFQEKLTAILTMEQDHTLQNLNKKRKQCSLDKTVKKSGRIFKTKMTPNIDRQIPNYRLKTQHKQSDSKLSNKRDGILPRIKYGERTRSYKRDDICDINKLSLQQVKQRLMRMKHSELGKRILIVNRYQN